MKRALPLFTFLIFFTGLLSAQSPNWQWARGSNGLAQTEGWSGAADAHGNVYAVGEIFEGTATFGPIALSDTSHSNSIVYLIKYDAAGNLAWVRGIDTSAAFPFAITVDAASHIYVTGIFQGVSSVFGNDTLFNAETAGGSSDIFIAKYDSAGNTLWAKRAGNIASDGGQGIATDVGNNVYVTGFMDGPNVWSTDTVNTGNNGSAFLTKLDPSGNEIWAKTVGPNSAARGMSVATDDAGDVYITGYYPEDSMVLGDSTFYNLFSNYYANVFIAKYDSLGNLLWARSAGGVADDQSNWVATDKEGNAYVTGYFRSDSITFGTHTLLNTCRDGVCSSADIFVVKYSSTGIALWAKSAGGIADDKGYSVATDAAGNLYVTGMLNSDSIAFDSTILVRPVVNTADASFLVSFDTAGAIMCAETFSSGGDDQNAVCLDHQGNAFFIGDFVLSPFIIGPDTLFGPPDTSVFFDAENLFVAKFRCGKGSEVGVENIEQNGTLKLYPNPFTNQATVQYSLPQNSKNAVLVIYDIAGREQKSYRLNNAEGTINVNSNGLSNGIYLYVLMVDRKALVTKKMVVE